MFTVALPDGQKSMVGKKSGRATQNPKPCVLFLNSTLWPVGVVLTISGEGSVLAGLPGGVVQTKSIPEGMGLEIDLSVPLLLHWYPKKECQRLGLMLPIIPHFLDIGVSEDWGLSFNQIPDCLDKGVCSSSLLPVGIGPCEKRRSGKWAHAQREE